MIKILIKMLTRFVETSSLFQGKLMQVAKRQYVQTIRKKSFWLATLLFPTFIIFVSFISGYTSTQSEKKVKEEVAKVDRIFVLDESGVINSDLLQSPYVVANEKNAAIAEVMQDQADAFFYYPSDLATGQKIEVYTQDTGLISYGRFDSVARQLLQTSILLKVGDADLISLYAAPIDVQTTYYKDGQTVSLKVEDFIVPIFSLVIYFTLVFMGTNFLLSSVSEEKENRMIEIVLTAMNSRDLIWGKIVGLVGIVLTQLIVLISLAGVGLWFTLEKLPFNIDLAAIPLDSFQITVSLFFIAAGFLMIAAIMVGVGAAMPTYREAQQFSSIFIILAIMPVYFVTLIVTDPTGVVARVTSYIPLTSPLVLLGRSALGGLPAWEAIVGIVVNVAYVVGAFYLAFRLFEIGSLEFNQKLSIKRLFHPKISKVE
ncbi:ABC transporter permease [candidate division WWE3 bacterium]|uniref:ABC transporter permease n=1 Tax=candidate division WWE3 bacterium TaxID=2053526 RepID=A0A955LK66_UNCKA|nr:ABC transporter permease [candidate division WWE3 bacterium]